MPHPVLALQGVFGCSNDSFAIGPDKPVILLSGPNAGGKTIGLKFLIGLMALLVKAGIPLPAEAGARCDYFHSIRVDIGDTQAVEVLSIDIQCKKLVSLKEILSNAGENCLILFR